MARVTIGKHDPHRVGAALAAGEERGRQLGCGLRQQARLLALREIRAG